ncbi:hypothetical protein [Kribbella sp. CA-293567]|uniref:hypothetical protein n=1 Tax=Kribbella sp. CA-293567 TaxID=3002436 RepID=UPI0022DCEF07|nr:hypothetical protein [Kribbella sp. CA-293567]WBQ02155.1 hypothetical protein OX958_19405 [Kribbella sp. CA-293567]
MAFRSGSAVAVAGAVAVLGTVAGTTASAASAVSAAPAVTAASCYASSGNLYCGNKVNASIWKSPRYDTPTGNPVEIVDTLRSGFSYFQCYTIGQSHGGGNSIWYRTYGDDHGAWGYVPAVDVWTPQDPFPGVAFC